MNRSRPVLRFLAGTVLLSAASLHAQASTTQVATRLAGCYKLFSGDGSPVGAHYYNASGVVRLDTTTVEDYPGLRHRARVVVRLDSLGPSRPRSRPIDAPRWDVSSRTDSVYVVYVSFHNGLSGASFQFGTSLQGDTLVGVAEEHFDFGPRRVDRGSAYAVRFRCP
jgi:hypothetical protein